MRLTTTCMTLTTELLPHQRAPVAKMLPLRVGALFMDMGTGKSRVALELISRRRRKISNVVWFCPVSAMTNIVEQVQIHSTFSVGLMRKTGPVPLVTVVGIESMSSSDWTVLRAAAMITDSTMVIVDESHLIKGHRAKRTARITRISARAKYRLLLSGTPITQGYADLFSQMSFLSPKILGIHSWHTFARRHIVYHEERRGQIVGYRGMDALVDKMEPFVYQVTKEEAVDLPDKLFSSVHVATTADQDRCYEEAKEFYLTQLMHEDSWDSGIWIFRLFTALQTIASGWWTKEGARIDIPSNRHQGLLSALDRIPHDEPVIVWTKYAESVERILEHLPQDDAVTYYGQTSKRDRVDNLAKFKAGDRRFFVATMDTGGTSLTLNNATYAVFYENSFKYGSRIQAEDRNHRVGQARPVTYIDVSCGTTIERRIQMALGTKADALSEFRRQVSGIKTKEQLLELI